MLIRFPKSIDRILLRVKGSPANDDGGVSIEFAFMVPLFLAVFFGVTEISFYNMNSRRAQQAVDFAAEYMSRDNDNILTQDERHVMEDIWQIVNTTSFYNSGGDEHENGRGEYTRSFASIEFEEDLSTCEDGEKNGLGVGLTKGASEVGLKIGHNKKKDCKIKPKVNWTFSASQGIDSPKRRSCEQNLVPNDEKLDETKLPEGVIARGAIVVADFTYLYEPFFDLDIIPRKETHISAIRMSRSGIALKNGDLASSHIDYCGAS